MIPSPQIGVQLYGVLEHFQPFSISQVVEHPSFDSLLKSSHLEFDIKIPSPQISSHLEGEFWQ